MSPRGIAAERGSEASQQRGMDGGERGLLTRSGFQLGTGSCVEEETAASAVLCGGRVSECARTKGEG